MEIRNTLPEDMDRVMFIFEQAKQFMRLNGNLHQWTGGYPSEEVLEADISSNSSFVCVDDQKEVVGTFCFRYGFSPEPTYNVIYDGGWLNEKPYGVIHRIASSGKVGGVFSACLEWCSRYVDNIRIDTHRDNRVPFPIRNRYRPFYAAIAAISGRIPCPAHFAGTPPGHPPPAGHT